MIAQAQDPYLQLALEFGGESIGFNFIDSKFNVEFANALAEIEAYNKHLYRPNTYLHKWWARRCGTTFRAILKHLVRDQAKQDFYAPGGLEGQIILDPMMGGGTTLHGAIRLGANVVGSDTVDKTDSYAFCEQCGSVLGYLLDQPGPESEIRMMWNRLLG